MAKEYIERNALIAEYDRVHIGPAGGARKLMVDAPTADVVEVKHGEWKRKGQDIYCSVCGNESAYNPFGASKFSDYCPNCGAKMDGKERG